MLFDGAKALTNESLKLCCKKVTHFLTLPARFKTENQYTFQI